MSIQLRTRISTFIYTYLHMSIQLRTRISTFIYTYLHMSIQLRTRISTFIYTYLRTRISTFIEYSITNTHIYLLTHEYSITNTHIYIYLYLHMSIQLRTRISTFIYTYLHMSIQLRTRISTFIYTYTCLFNYEHAYVHLYSLTHDPHSVCTYQSFYDGSLQIQILLKVHRKRIIIIIHNTKGALVDPVNTCINGSAVPFVSNINGHFISRFTQS